MYMYIGQWLGEYWIVWITPSSFLLIYFIVLPRNWITQIKSLQFFRVSSQPFYKPGKVATSTHKALNKILPIGQVAKKNGTKTRWRRDGRIANGSGPGGPTLSTGCTMMHISKHCVHALCTVETGVHSRGDFMRFWHEGLCQKSNSVRWMWPTG